MTPNHLKAWTNTWHIATPPDPLQQTPMPTPPAAAPAAVPTWRRFLAWLWTQETQQALASLVLLVVIVGVLTYGAMQTYQRMTQPLPTVAPALNPALNDVRSLQSGPWRVVVYTPRQGYTVTEYPDEATAKHEFYLQRFISDYPVYLCADRQPCPGAVSATTKHQGWTGATQ